MTELIDPADRLLYLDRVWSVYFYYAVNGELLYVGVTSNGPLRGRQHNHTAPWWPLAVRAEFEHFGTAEDALNAERSYIADLDPIFNRAEKVLPSARTGLRPQPPKGVGAPGHTSGSSPRSPELPSPELAADGVSKLWDGYVNDRDASLRRRWGLKLFQWEAIRDAGDPHGGCAGCGRRNVRLVVDDDHDTGELCGTLCDTCNRKLTERLRRYVQNPPSRLVAKQLGIKGFFLPLSRREAFERSRAGRREQQARWRAKIKQRTRGLPPPDDYHAKVTAALEATKQGGA
jgi:hypothetical protein